MTEPIFFDTDCLSAFLWVDNQSLLAQLYPGRVVLYQQLTNNPAAGHVIIGRGEAAGIVLAKIQGGIIASNNLRDISAYIEEFSLQHVTTGDILKEALAQGLITENIGNQLWANMLKKRRKLGYPTFSAFLAANP